MLPRPSPAWRGNLISNYWGKQVSYSDSLEANILIGSVWNKIYTSANAGPISTAVNVNAQMHFTKWGAFIWNHAKNTASVWLFADWFPLTQGHSGVLWSNKKRKNKRNEQRIFNILSLCFHHKSNQIWQKKNDTSTSVLHSVCPECVTFSQPGPRRRLRNPPSRASAPSTPKLTGLAQLQLNKKGIASVKTQFTNMTSPLPWLEIWNIDLCAVKGLIKMITYTWGINAQKINRNFILDTRLSPMVKC